MLERVAYQDAPVRHEYRLTAKGRAFYDVLAAMWRFGNDWLWPDGERPPLQLVDRDSGDPVVPRVVDETTGDPIDVRRLQIKLAHPSQGRPTRPTRRRCEPSTRRARYGSHRRVRGVVGKGGQLPWAGAASEPVRALRGWRRGTGSCGCTRRWWPSSIAS